MYSWEKQVVGNLSSTKRIKVLSILLIFLNFCLQWVGHDWSENSFLLPESVLLSLPSCDFVIHPLLSFFSLPVRCYLLPLDLYRLPKIPVQTPLILLRDSETALHTKWRCLLLSSQSPVNVHITKPQHLIVSDWLSLLSLNSQAWVSQGTLLPFILYRVVQPGQSRGQ